MQNSETHRTKARVPRGHLQAPRGEPEVASSRPHGRRIPAEGDLAVGEWRGHATSIVDRPYDNEYCRVIRVAEDQIGEVRAYLDDALGEELFRTTQRKQEHLSTGAENVTDTSNQPPTIDDGQLNGKFETGRRTSFPPHSSDSIGGP